MSNARIIPLPPNQSAGRKVKTLNIDKLANDAWNFAHTILWPHQPFCYEDVTRTVSYIRSYFENSEDKKKAFTCFCERIIITNRFIAAKPNRYVPNPAVWFNGNYEYGFAGTKKWHQHVEARREDIPGYLQHISVIASHYLDYTIKPSEKTFNKCRGKLLELKAYGLLQYFYNAIIHLSYSIQS